MGRWTPPNNPTKPARQIWAALFPGHPWPARWRVEWAGFMRGASGLCIYRERRILLSYGDFKRPRPGKRGPVETLIHEFVHVRCRGLRHGAEFRRIENSLRARMGLERKEGP
jgi:hypothetical protein